MIELDISELNLGSSMNAANIKLDEKVIEKIEEIHKKNPNPCP